MIRFRPLRFAAPFRPPPARHTGFSLVELTIAVLIASILLTMGLAAFSMQVEATALSATQKRQDTIKEALIAYLRTHRRLPCPETTALNGSPPTGAESRGTSNPPQCLSFWGTLPFATLGLSRDTALDGYGNYFTYYVSAAAINSEPDWTLTSRSGVPGFNVGNPGRFAITERIGAALVPATNAANLAAAVIVSHGKNGSGAFTLKGTRIAQPPAGSDERTATPNTPPASPPAWVAPGALTGCGSTCPTPGMLEFITKDHTDDAGSPGGAYDDIVLVLRPNDLLGPIIKDGAMKSAEAQLSDSFARIKSALASYALSHSNTHGGGNCQSTTPPYCLLLPTTLMAAGLAPDDVTDPWGMDIQYVPNSSLDQSGPGNGLSNTSPPSGDAYTLKSYGPDRQANTPDDKTLPVSLIELRQMIGPANLASPP
jgi:prepilin-type N-terminal cleavage/methylation domain-containing protein